MSAITQLPIFASEEWYLNPGDHRCPHDAWLESVELSEAASGDRNQVRKTNIVLRLLGAYHDGHIVFYYSDVLSYALTGVRAERGLGDWLSDRFEVTANGAICHEIRWAGFGAGQESRWVIEAREVRYEWKPKAKA